MSHRSLFSTPNLSDDAGQYLGCSLIPPPSPPIDSSRYSALNVTYFRGKARKGQRGDIHLGFVTKNQFGKYEMSILSMRGADNRGRCVFP